MDDETELTPCYITFGVQYSYEPHPLGSWVHPDGYLTVLAPSYEEARRLAWEITQGKFAFDYDEPLSTEHAPRGELARIVFTHA